MSKTGELFEKLVDVIAKLRSPDGTGCPWDREQTHLSLRPYLLEEVYEFIESAEENDIRGMKEELGDILLHIIFHSDIERENGNFTIDDVLELVIAKLIARHPHVFGSAKANDADEVLQRWEHLKLHERKSKNDDASLLDGIPESMPSLIVAQRMQEKASRIGFDWQKIDDVWEKIKEELNELGEIIHKDNITKIEDEIGDILFAVTNLARFKKISSEMALRKANEKFRRRFKLVEKRLREEKIKNPTLEKMDEFWEEAKNKESGAEGN